MAGYAASTGSPASFEAAAYHLITTEDDLLHLGGLLGDLERVGGKLASLFP